MRNLKNIATTELWTMIEDLGKNGHNVLLQQCEILYEIYKRGEKHPLHKGKAHHKIYRHFEAIALGRITPALAMYLNGDAGKVAKFSTYRPETQDIASADRPFTVAVVNSETGEIVKGEKIVRKMTAIELDLVFPGNGYLPTFSEQAAKLAEIRTTHPVAVEAAPKVAVHSEVSIKVRGNVVTIDELKAVLAQLGYSVTKG